MNSIRYYIPGIILLMLAFLVMAGEVSLISLSFGFVALLSARILNWQKNRLELQTEQMRNAYLACAFLIIPYSLYNSMPEGYLILSWVVVTILYYALGYVLKNIKYRWMGHLTLLLTVIYVVGVGSYKLKQVHRIVSFLIVGVLLLIVSLVYTKLKSKLPSSGESDQENSNKKQP